MNTVLFPPPPETQCRFHSVAILLYCILQEAVLYKSYIFFEVSADIDGRFDFMGHFC
jgi:hypothetical protein